MTMMMTSPSTTTTTTTIIFLLSCCFSPSIFALPIRQSNQLLSFLRTRAPHFANLLSPIPGYVLLGQQSSNTSTQTDGTVSNSSSSTIGQLLVTYRNGERADESTLSVSLANQTAVYLIANALPFVDNWYTVNTTIPISFTELADGNYTLLAQEIFENEVTAELEQPFYITHDSVLASALTASQNDTLYSQPSSFVPGGGGGGGDGVLGTVAGQEPASTSIILPTVTVVQSLQSGSGSAVSTTDLNQWTATSVISSAQSTATSLAQPLAQESSNSNGSIQEGLAGLVQDLKGLGSE